MEELIAFELKIVDILELINIDSINTFKLNILNFVRPRKNSVFAVHDINGVKLLTSLRLKIIHLNKHKLRHNFNQ